MQERRFLLKVSLLLRRVGTMIETGSIKREAMHLLPEILEGLLDVPAGSLRLRRTEADGGADLTADARGRRMLLEVKSSSRPSVVAGAKAQLQRAAGGDPDTMHILVVPFMTEAGAQAADQRRLDWVDLSGNAHIRAGDLLVWVQGRPNRFVQRGRPSSAFAPKSSRVTRALLLEPTRWWLQRELADVTGLNDGHVSRIVGRLDADELLDRDRRSLRPRNPELLLDAWAADYRFDRHDLVLGHTTGTGIALARELKERLSDAGIRAAFTGLAAAWALEPFARFRLVSVYVEGDPRDAATAIGLRRDERGANVQLLGPDDAGVWLGERTADDLPCVAPVQAYLDLMHLPERAKEAAATLRNEGRLWDAGI